METLTRLRVSLRPPRALRSYFYAGTAREFANENRRGAGDADRRNAGLDVETDRGFARRRLVVSAGAGLGACALFDRAPGGFAECARSRALSGEADSGRCV